jgi:hypothetical protein
MLTVKELLLKLDDGDNQDIHKELLSHIAALQDDNRHCYEVETA